MSDKSDQVALGCSSNHLGEQSGLAYPGVTGQQHRASLTAYCTVQQFGQAGQF